MGDSINISHDKSKVQNFNTSMLIMQCIGIIAVVFGHVDIGGEDIPNFINLAFPYYSWHMPFFVFISGYFFNRKRPAIEYIFGKTRSHLLPALAVNAVSGIFSFCLKAFEITNYGQSITLKSLFITPFTTGYQFYINVSLWFVFALVIIEIISCVMDRMAKGKGDLLFLVITLVIAICCCYKVFYDHEGTRDEYYNAALRLGFLMFFFWLGVCYRRYAEKFLKKLLNYKGSILLFLLQATILGVTGDKIAINTRDMNFSSLTMPNGFWVAIITPITATLFFLGISYSLEPYFSKSKTLVTFGSNTKYVMYYHQLIFVLYSVGIAVLTKCDILNISGFSFEKMANSAYYTGGNLALSGVVAVLAIILPISICGFLKRQRWYVSAIAYMVLTAGIVLFLYLAGIVLN